jgi:hypothetical protein
MSALKTETSERVRAEEAVEIIDCGRASERTKGVPLLLFYEYGSPPYIYLPII